MTNTIDAMPAEIDVKSLGCGDWTHLIFGFFWRGIVYTIACMIGAGIVGGVVGGVMGVVAAAGGVTVDTITRMASVLGAVLGVGVGVIGLRFYIHWLLVSRFGVHRLVLVRAGAP